MYEFTIVGKQIQTLSQVPHSSEDVDDDDCGGGGGGGMMGERTRGRMPIFKLYLRPLEASYVVVAQRMDRCSKYIRHRPSYVRPCPVLPLLPLAGG